MAKWPRRDATLSLQSKDGEAEHLPNRDHVHGPSRCRQQQLRAAAREAAAKADVTEETNVSEDINEGNINTKVAEEATAYSANETSQVRNINNASIVML